MVVVVVAAAVMLGMHQEGVDRDDGRTMTMPRTLIILAVIAMRTGAEAGMMWAATWVGDVAPMSTARMAEYGEDDDDEEDGGGGGGGDTG